MNKTAFALVLAVQMGGVAIAEARDQIRIVGSSTVFPFSTAVAEQFGRTTSFPTPIVESTGSGGGLKLFCEGVGTNTPDMTNSSRRIKASEVALCASNGVTEITEVRIGFDGIVLANAKSGPSLDVSLKQVFLALAKEVPVNGKLVANPYTKWNEIDASLPDMEIEVLGPPPTSGTRDAFVELAMEAGCESVEGAAELGLEGKACHIIREDGRFVEAGENDNLIVQKLEANPAAYGIFGFSFLDQNADKMKGATVAGVEPEFENIAAGDYPVSRSLYFYVKKAHAGVIPGIEAYLAEFTSDRASGPDGYLLDKGLIPLPDDQRDLVRQQAESLANLTM
ncbi:MAG: substrate-binding domain-containing protein [Rhodospirillaceae bacterium]